MEITELVPSEELKRAQREILLDLEQLRNVANVVARGAGRREVALTITKLQEAHSWLSLALQEIEGQHAQSANG